MNGAGEDPVVGTVGFLLLVSVATTLLWHALVKLWKAVGLKKRVGRFLANLVVLLILGAALFDIVDTIALSHWADSVYAEFFAKTLIASIGAVILVCQLCRILKWVEPNWQGRQIPARMGICFPAVWLLSTSWNVFWMAGNPRFEASHPGWFINWGDCTNWPFVLLLVAFSLLGLCKDFCGRLQPERQTASSPLFRIDRRLTTERVRVLAGCIVALSFAYYWFNHWELAAPAPLVLLGALSIVLCAETVNLTNSHSGRALKAFAVLFVAFCGLGRILPFPRPSSVSMWPAECTNATLTQFLILLPVLVYAPLDFRAKRMMGCVGSNALGALAGWRAMTTLSLPGQVFVAVMLLVLHLCTRKRSLNELVTEHPVLDWLDRFGTGRGKKTAIPGAGE